QASPAATAAPLPEEEPHALRSVACGFLVRPPIALHPLVERVERILAHSDKLVLPSTTPPASRSRAIRGARGRSCCPSALGCRRWWAIRAFRCCPSPARCGLRGATPCCRLRA